MLIGLVFVALGYPGADAIAALFVAVLVVIAALRLARQSIDVLMDRASHEAEEQRPRGAGRRSSSRSSCAACACATPPAATSSTS